MPSATAPSEEHAEAELVKTVPPTGASAESAAAAELAAAESAVVAVSVAATESLAVAEAFVEAELAISMTAVGARGVVGGRPLATGHARAPRLIAARARVRWRFVCLGGAAHSRRELRLSH